MKVTTDELARMLGLNPDISVAGTPQAQPVSAAPQAAKPTKRGEPEHLMQVAVIAECNRRAEQDPRWNLLLAIPNGGHRSKRTAGKLKNEGVRAGVPDLLLPIPRPATVACPAYHGLFIELKCGKNKQSAYQAAWAKVLTEQGYRVEVIYDNPQHAINIIEWYLDGEVEAT